MQRRALPPKHPADTRLWHARGEGLADSPHKLVTAGARAASALASSPRSGEPLPSQGGMARGPVALRIAGRTEVQSRRAPQSTHGAGVCSHVRENFPSCTIAKSTSTGMVEVKTNKELLVFCQISIDG
jgi:hypothetical protein